MKKLFEDIVLTGLGTLVVTKEKAEELVEKMIKQGDVTREEGKELLNKFIEKTEEGGSRLSEHFLAELKQRLNKAGFVTRQELEDIKSRLDHLEHRLDEIKEEKKEESNE